MELLIELQTLTIVVDVLLGQQHTLVVQMQPLLQEKTHKITMDILQTFIQ